MKRYISLNVTLHSFDVSTLLKSSDPNVVSLIKDMVYNTVLREFTKPMHKYGLTKVLTRHIFISNSSLGTISR